MADGSIVITAELDDKKAQAELARLTKRINDLHAQIQRAQAAKMPLLEQAEELGVKLDVAKANLEEMLAAPTGRYTAEQIADQKELVASLQYQWNQAEKGVERYDRQISNSTQKLGEAESRAGELSSQLSQMGDVGQQSASKIDLGLGNMVNGVEKIGKRISRLAKRVLFFSVITKALRGLRSWFGDAIKGSEETTNAISALKGALLTLAQPIMQHVLPVLTLLINALAKVAMWIAAVVAALFGTTAADAAAAAEALESEKDAIDGVGGAAGKAAKQLAGFDEINKLGEPGGGGGGASKAAKSMFDAVKEFQLPDWLDEFLGNFRITVQDVLFDWSDLTGEQIAKKAIAGLTTLTGGVIGFTLGGVPGALVGSLAGLALGLIIDSVIFDSDGKLSKNEILRSLQVVIFSLAGAAVGFVVGGGVLGAAIGFTVGAVLSLVITGLDVQQEKDLKAKAGNTLLGKAAAEALEKGRVSLQAAADLSLQIESITGEVSPEKLAEISMARDLIESIFTLDANQNKTAGEIERIKALIGELNGLGLDGVTLAFDDATQSVVGTKDAILGAVDALLQQYQVEAMRDAYIEAYRAQYDAYRQLTDATTELEQANEKHAEALDAVAAATERYEKASEWQYEDRYRISQWSEEMRSATEELQIAQANLQAVEEAQSISSQALEQSMSNFDVAKQKVVDLGNAYEDLVLSISDHASAAADGGRDIMNGTAQGIDEGYAVAEDAITRAHRALQDAANVVDGINSPSTVYAQHGRFIMEGLAGGIEKFGYLAIR